MPQSATKEPTCGEERELLAGYLGALRWLRRSKSVDCCRDEYTPTGLLSRGSRHAFDSLGVSSLIASFGRRQKWQRKDSVADKGAGMGRA